LLRTIFGQALNEPSSLVIILAHLTTADGILVSGILTGATPEAISALIC